MGIDRQLLRTEQQLLGQVYRDRAGLIALSQDMTQPESVRQEALRNVKMIDGDLRFAQIVDQHFWTVAGAAMTLPLTGGLSSIGGTVARQSLIGAGVGGGFDIAGQLYKGEAFRPGQTIVATLTGAVGGPLVTKSTPINALVGGGVNAVNTWAANQIYGDKQNVTTAFVAGFGFSLVGASLGQNYANYLTKTSPITIGNPPIPNPYPARAGKWVETGISNSTVFMDLEKGDKK